MKHQIIIFTLGTSLILFLNSAIAQVTDHSKLSMDMNHDMKIVEFHNIDPVFQKQLKKVFLATLTLNDAFIAEDVSKVKAASSKVKDQIGKVDMMLLSVDPHMRWLNYLRTMFSNLKQITSATTIDTQRSYFAKYNQALYQSIKTFGIDNKAFYQFCPMVDNNEGAFWLSDHEKILNPYMGNNMLSCGTAKEIVNTIN